MVYTFRKSKLYFQTSCISISIVGISVNAGNSMNYPQITIIALAVFVQCCPTTLEMPLNFSTCEPRGY